jgi:hypothetical protein
MDSRTTASELGYITLPKRRKGSHGSFRMEAIRIDMLVAIPELCEAR